MEVPSYLPQLLYELNEQRKRGFFCDCSILVEGRVFKAHRNVLFAGSGYFQSLLVHYLQVSLIVLLMKRRIRILKITRHQGYEKVIIAQQDIAYC